MIEIYSRQDLISKIPSKHNSFSIFDELVRNLIDNYPQFSKEADGGFVLLEEQTNDFTRPLVEIWPVEPYTLSQIPFENILKSEFFYEALFLANNQLGIYFLIPQSPTMPPEVQSILEEQVDHNL